MYSFFHTRTIAVTLVLLLVAMSTPRAGAASGPTQKLREQLKPLAKTIRDILKQEDQTTIAVGDFNGPAQFTSNYGAGIHQLLADELEILQKGIVNPNSVLSVKGDYEYIQGRELSEIQISIAIKKNNGEKITNLSKRLLEEPIKINDSELIAAMTGRSIHLPPAANKKQLNDKIKENIKNPQFHKQGGRIATQAGSPFAIELLATSVEQAPTDRAGWGRVLAREVQDEKGEAYVPIKTNEVYAVRVFNGSKHDAAVTLTIDGLDVFAFSEVRTPEGRPRYTHFIVRPGDTIITGWHKTSERSDSFLVTEYGKGAISKNPQVNRDKVGVLTVTFALAWEGDKVPEEEKIGGRSVGGNETGFGPPVKEKFTEVQRRIGVIRDNISVRYTR